jgi:hypothetical protein
VRRSEQIHEEIPWLEVTHTRGVDDAAENLLRLGAAWRPIAARDLPIHDGRPQRLLSAPIRSVHREIKQKPKSAGSSVVRCEASR